MNGLILKVLQYEYDELNIFKLFIHIHTYENAISKQIFGYFLSIIL